MGLPKVIIVSAIEKAKIFLVSALYRLMSLLLWFVLVSALQFALFVSVL